MPIQDHIDIFYLAREMPASEKTALEAVMEADEERLKLEKLAEELALNEDEESQDYLMEVRTISVHVSYGRSSILQNSCLKKSNNNKSSHLYRFTNV